MKRPSILPASFGLALLPLLQGCYYLQRATVPMETIVYPVDGAEAEPAKHLFVLLPGLGDSVEAFEERGLVEFLRSDEFARGLSRDVVAVNAHVKYYSNRSAIVRLEQDVIGPALARGYEQIHLVGISLGGFGALLYLREHPDRVSSVTLLGSYLGKPDYVRHLRDERLDPPEVIEDQNLWPWLLSLPVEQREKIFMGYGRQDRFAVLNEELARRLDPEQSVVVEGKHRWTVWSEIWPELLPRVAQAARLREAVLADARAQTDAG